MVSMTGPGDLSGERAAQARGPCEFLVATGIHPKGQRLAVACRSGTGDVAVSENRMPVRHRW